MLRQKSLLRAGLAMTAVAGVLAGSVRVQAVPSQAPAAPAPAVGFARGRIIVGFRAGVPAQQGVALARAIRARGVKAIAGGRLQVVHLPLGMSEEAALRMYAGRPEVTYAQLDRKLAAEAVPNDPYYSSAWHLPKISGPTAWDGTTGTSSIKVAILDTGVDGNHPDLSGRMVPGWNIWDNNSDTSDVHGHGTTVAGTAAAATNNGSGVAAVAWNCSIMPVRVTGTDGYAYESTIASGLEWAANNGARVANVSFRASGSPAVSSAAQYFQSKGGVVAVSAGNQGVFDSAADDPHVMTVSATDSNDNLPSWSNRGNNIDVAAPGVSIYTTARGGGITTASGTSFSAPVVAGIAALVLSANPALTPAQVEDAIEKGADDRGEAGWDTSYGHGRVNAAEAVRLAGGATSSDLTAPTVTITSPAAGATVSGMTNFLVDALDNVGVASVDFFIDGVKQLTDSVAPFGYTWDTATVANGSRVLTATARDAAGNSSSAQITVNVSNGTTADLIAPTVAITSPAAGATVSGLTNVLADALDNVGVASVEFYVNGVKKVTDSAAPFGFTWDTGTVGNGSHILTATARDAAGNSASTQITVNVSNVSSADTTAPTVTITSPGEGARIGRSLSVYVSAGDNVGVTRVELYVDGRYVDSETVAPFTTSVNTKRWYNGAHTLQVKAFDAAGNAGLSQVVTVYK